MFATVEGVYRNGKVELIEVPENIRGDINAEIRVIVTFLPAQYVDLQARGMDEAQAAELRARLIPFAEDWNQPEMDFYDNYESNQLLVSPR